MKSQLLIAVVIATGLSLTRAARADADIACANPVGESIYLSPDAPNAFQIELGVYSEIPSKLGLPKQAYRVSGSFKECVSNPDIPQIAYCDTFEDGIKVTFLGLEDGSEHVMSLTGVSMESSQVLRTNEMGPFNALDVRFRVYAEGVFAEEEFFFSLPVSGPSAANSPSQCL